MKNYAFLNVLEKNLSIKMCCFNKLNQWMNKYFRTNTRKDKIILQNERKLMR